MGHVLSCGAGLGDDACKHAQGNDPLRRQATSGKDGNLLQSVPLLHRALFLPAHSKQFSRLDFFSHILMLRLYIIGVNQILQKQSFNLVEHDCIINSFRPLLIDHVTANKDRYDSWAEASPTPSHFKQVQWWGRLFTAHCWETTKSNWD